MLSVLVLNVFFKGISGAYPKWYLADLDMNWCSEYWGGYVTNYWCIGGGQLEPAHPTVPVHLNTPGLLVSTLTDKLLSPCTGRGCINNPVDPC